MFVKVRAAFIVFALAALAGVAGAVADYDWGTLGSFGPAAGAFLAAAVAWLIRETAFYGGNGAPPQLPDQGDDPQLPG